MCVCHLLSLVCGVGVLVLFGLPPCGTLFVCCVLCFDACCCVVPFCLASVSSCVLLSRSALIWCVVLFCDMRCCVVSCAMCVMFLCCVVSIVCCVVFCVCVALGGRYCDVCLILLHTCVLLCGVFVLWCACAT